MDALFARRQQNRAGLGQAVLRRIIGGQQMRYGAALKIALWRDIIGLAKSITRAAQKLFYFAPVPDIKATLFALAIGVEAGRKRAFCGQHVGLEPTNGFFNASSKKRLFCVAIKQA